MRFASALILGWSITYITCALILPDIGLNRYLMFIAGILEALPVLIREKHPKMASYLFFFTGIAEIVGGVLSWAGIPIWNVQSFGMQAIYQVTMAFMDFSAGVVMLSESSLA